MARAAESYNRYRDVFEAMREDEQLTGSVQVDANGNKIRINAQILNSILPNRIPLSPTKPFVL